MKTNLRIQSRIAEIEKRLDAATPGPWSAGMSFTGKYPKIYGRNYESVAIATKESDADFIAHARADVEELLEEVKRLKEERS